MQPPKDPKQPFAETLASAEGTEMGLPALQVFPVQTFADNENMRSFGDHAKGLPSEQAHALFSVTSKMAYAYDVLVDLQLTGAQTGMQATSDWTQAFSEVVSVLRPLSEALVNIIDAISLNYPESLSDPSLRNALDELDNQMDVLLSAVKRFQAAVIRSVPRH